MRLRCLYIYDPRIAIFFLSLYALACGAFQTYLSGIITVLERRFPFRSRETGVILSGNEFGYAVCVLFIAYYGGQGKESLTLGTSAVALALGAMLFTTPFLLFGPKYQPYQLLPNSTVTSFPGLLAKQLTQLSNTTTIRPYNPINTLICSPEQIQAGHNLRGLLLEQSSEKWLAFTLLFLSNVILGVASCPMWNVGLTLIDNMSGRKSAIYICKCILIFQMLHQI
ncbi:unnamed protein product [Protopolystoma xenopodis]|uniref:Major facilitator superfamily (MFS) profile domain-containing protein n=1 Tax=Protopolystoma xenopodis TaxID=117903 RepID=A0A3S4ZZP4_9PLAT|nr:unnamed protein product [Protopolystoma xenopodis]